MKKMTTLLLTLMVSVATLYGQVSSKSLLWEISGNGLEKSSYLYGTFHLLCPDDLQIKDKVKNAVGASEQLVLELDFDDPSVMQTIQQNMAYSDGTTAKDYLRDSEYELVAGFFKDSLQLPFERLHTIKPFFLSSMTLMHFAGCQPVSFEQKLTSMAKNEGIEVAGLETVQEQMGFIEGIPMEMQKKMLLENLQHYDSSRVMFRKMMRCYLNEDLPGLNDISQESFVNEEYVEFRENLLINRNKDWIPRIEELVKKEASFIAVGAAHLPGKEGVIDLLRKKGYRVKPVY
ncbi:MAG TPA: TraB/GumN family protein [Bacteroidales bacterium]|nr:TraB/GumN family protein [Bacteroidales bacterium]